MLDLDALGRSPEYSALSNSQRTLCVLLLVSGWRDALASAYPEAPKDEAGARKYFDRYISSEACQKFLHAALQPSKSEKVLREVSRMADQQSSAEALASAIRAGIIALENPGVAIRGLKKER